MIDTVVLTAITLFILLVTFLGGIRVGEKLPRRKEYWSYEEESRD